MIKLRCLSLKFHKALSQARGEVLPGMKVTAEVAKIRGIPIGKDSISPNRHPEVSNAKELLDYIKRIKKIH